MKKKILSTFLMALVACAGSAQLKKSMDSLKLLLQMSKDDSSRIIRMAAICRDYAYYNFDSAKKYGQTALELSKQNNYMRGEARSLYGLSTTYYWHGDIAYALELTLTGLKLAEENNLEAEKASLLTVQGFIYKNLKDYPKAISLFKEASFINQSINTPEGLEHVKFETGISLSNAFAAINELDSALLVLLKLLPQTQTQTQNSIWRGTVLNALGDTYALLGDYPKALSYSRQALDTDAKKDNLFSIIYECLSLSNIFQKMNMADSCIFYAKNSLDMAQKLNDQFGILAASKILSEQYESLSDKKALYYLKIYEATYDELYGPEKVLALQKTLLDEQQRKRDTEASQIAAKNQMKQYIFLGGLVIALLIAFLFYRNNRQKQKANKVLETTLSHLKSTQSQLIQSEKMASLGELTAGIAHEIQNPLNFVNNFSEVNTELIEEMKTELKAGNNEDAIAIANDIADNEQKINHHGKRADAIVKGMLQHSRSSSGVKEPTDINALADEYLRLAYHGLRAKDKSFNATMKTEFDKTIGNVNIIPQDIGRVILNLITNAFYAAPLPPPAGGVFPDPDYKHNPTVWVSTKKVGNMVEIRVRDNGPGIPQKILDKIFQPFFTTKPTGQGTGLGLSLSYDIVKAHGGEIKVKTTEGKGSEFVIKLPFVNYPG